MYYINAAKTNLRTKIVIFFLYSYLCCDKKSKYMRYIKSLLLLVVVLMSTIATYASAPLRECYNINDGWRFYFADAPDGANADYVTLPHTWNVEATEDTYLRTTANYLRDINIPAEWEGKRLFVRFGGAQSVAELFVNGRYVGEHRGGFTAFTLEITDHVRYGAENHLRVVVSNAHRSDVLPLSSDVNLAGGIYRDVELLITSQNIISPMYYGSEGVIVEQHKVTPDIAEGVVKVYLSTKSIDHTMVTMRIVDEDGYEVISRTIKAAKISPDRAVDIHYAVEHPLLWSPDCRTMYDVEIVLGDVKNPLDRVVVKTGFRSVSVGEDNVLCINGVPIDVRGVNLSHDRDGVGVALERNHYDEDFAIIRDMGANAVRSLVGPHDDYLYDMCDREGVLVWVDMPLARSDLSLSDICYYPTQELRKNGFDQLREIVLQNYNHPSVVMWGLFWLVWQRGDDVLGYIGELNDLAHKLDSSRPTVSCSNSDGAINFVTDLVVLRQNVGWMKGSIEDVDIWCDQLASNKSWAALRCGVNYGEAGVRSHNAERIERAERNSRHLPERRQSDMHERYVEQIDKADIFWGVWIDNMFDYASARRSYGCNLAGMVERDHKTKKDAYYLYRARWNAAVPTLHIADKGWCNRREQQQTIDVYSSVGMPVLDVAGERVVMHKVGDAHYRAEVTLNRGTTTIHATDATGRHSDSITLRIGGFAAR